MATRIFLCNKADNPLIDSFIDEAMRSIREGCPYRVFWECSNNRTVKAGDTVFFKRTQDKPLGYFASGVVVAAHSEEQLGDFRKRAYRLEKVVGSS